MNRSNTFQLDENRVVTMDSLKKFLDTYNLKKGISSSCEQTYAYMLKLYNIKDDPIPFQSFGKKSVL